MVGKREFINILLDPRQIDEMPRLSNLVPNCLSLAQIDPVEARCGDMKSLLRSDGRRISDEVINTCITREKIVQAIGLFGQHFQRHLPILHAASFSLSQAPSGLLLAMFCVGACYDNTIMDTENILRTAMHILTDIESQPVSNFVVTS